MIQLLVVLLALSTSDDPKIEKVESLIGDIHRPLLWTPLKVTLTSTAGFQGDLVAASSFGFSTAVEVKVAPGGNATVILPALDPAELTAGKTSFKLPKAYVKPERLVLVDARLPYAGELESTEKILFRKISPEDLEQTLARGLLEAADLILLREAASPWPSAVVAPTRDAAEKAIAAAGEREETVEAVDLSAWTLAPGEGWVPVKKSWTGFFAAVYAFTAFVGLAVAARRFPRFGLAAVAAVAVLGIAGYLFAFPRRQAWVVERGAEAASPRGASADHRYWFVAAAAPIETSIEFPRLVKPVFPSPAGTDDPFTLRPVGRGCRVQGLRLLPGRPACFGGTEGRPASTATIGRVPRPLSEAMLVRDGKLKQLGDVPAGVEIPAAIEGPGTTLRSAEFDAWKRFVRRDALFGILGTDEPRAVDVTSADLADGEKKPRVLIQRFK